MEESKIKQTATIDLLTSHPYNLSAQAAIGIIECVSAWTKYESLPQASRDSLQAICDLFQVGLTFVHIRKKLVLTGIFKPHIRATYLYTAKTLENNRQLQNKSELLLLPGNDNKLVMEA